VLTEEIVENISKSSGQDKASVRKQCENFIEKHPKGSMSKSEFKEFLKQALPNLNMQKKMEDNVFRMYDTNMDGVISMDEFLVVYHIFNGGTAEENLLRIFRIFDVDNNGVISKSELRKLVKDMFGIIEGSNKGYTKDGLTNSTWLEMDKDADGSITAKEFVAAVLAQEQFSKETDTNICGKTCYYW